MTKHRPTIDEICRLTGLVFCDENCGCGGNSRLFFTTDGTPDEWKCANGWTREDVEREIAERKAEAKAYGEAIEPLIGGHAEART